MLHYSVALCYTIGIGKAPIEKGKPMEVLGIITAMVNLITALILWQTAKRNKRRD